MGTVNAAVEIVILKVRTCGDRTHHLLPLAGDTGKHRITEYQNKNIIVMTYNFHKSVHTHLNQC